MRRIRLIPQKERGLVVVGVLLVTSLLALPLGTVRAAPEAAPLPSSFACPATLAGEVLLKDGSLRNDSEVAAAGIDMPPGFRQLDCTYAIPKDANQGIKFNVQYFAQGDPNIGNDGICEKSYDAGSPVNGDTSLYFNDFVAGFDTYGAFYSTTKIVWTSFSVPGSDPTLVDPVQRLTQAWFVESLALAGDCPGRASPPPSSQAATSLPAANVVASGTEGPTPGELAIAAAIILLLLGAGTGVGLRHHGDKQRLTGTVPPPPTAPSAPPPPPEPAAPNYIAGEFLTDFIREEVSLGTHVPPRDTLPVWLCLPRHPRSSRPGSPSGSPARP